MNFKRLPIIYLRFLLLFVGFESLAGTSYAQLTTTRKGNYGSMTYLVDSVLLGKGITASNITWTNMDTAFGFFNGKSSNIGMDSGIIMCNGGIGLAQGPNKKSNDKSNGPYTTYNYSTTDGWPNAGNYEDQDLATLLGEPITETYSCFILQFDFIAPSDSVEFQYVFGSNEEPCFGGDKYFDDFGFFLSGPGIAGPFSNSAINLAVLPGSNTAVAIDNVNCNSNSAYYVCNSPPATSGSNCSEPCTSCPANSAATTVGYGGFTTVLTAKASVKCGQKYHIKLGVANIYNGEFDSGVFLKGGSFKPNNVPMSVSAPVSTCANTPITISASGAVSYTWSPAGSLNTNTGGSVIATPSVTTTYTVIGNMAGGCIDTGKITVTVPANPTLSVTPSAPAICSGGSVNMVASGASTYIWTPSAGLTCTSCASTTANPATTTKYYVTGTAADGCINKDSVTITVAASLPVTAATASPTVCSADSVLLSANGASSFSWSPATGLACSTCANTLAASGNVTYTVTGTSSGCSNTANVTISSIPSPTVTASSLTSAICTGIADTLKAGGAISYTWSPSTGLSNSTGSPVAATPTVATTYVVTGTAANGCTLKDSVTIGINPSPTITTQSSSPSYICSGTTDTLTASGAVSYVWSPASLLNTSTGPQVWTTPTVTTTYTVIGTNALGCTDTANLTVTVVTTPTVSLNVTNAGVCPGDSVLIIASGASYYSWSPTTGIDSLNTDSITIKPGSTSTYTVTGYGGGCQSKEDSVTITVGKLVVSATAVSSTLCSGNSTGITASGAVSYMWTPGTTLNDSVTATVTATPSVTTTYTITGTSGAGCNADTTITITVNPTPTLSLTADSAVICFGGGGTWVIARGAATYSWSPTGSVTCSSCDTANANPNTTTTYTVTGTSSLGCPATGTVTVSVDHPVIKTQVSAAAICNGASDTITATGNVSYTWSPSTALNTTSGATVVANPAADTTYKVVGIDTLGCKDSATQYIKVNQNPLITATPSSTSICNGNSDTLTATGASNYIWTPSSSVNCSTCASTSVSPSATTTYTLVGINAVGCTDTISVPITVNTNPNIKIVPPSGDTLCPNATVTMTASGGTTYTWSPSTGLNQTTGASVIASAPNPGPITYTIKGSNGTCTDSDKTTLYAYPPFKVTNTSTSICDSQKTQISALASGGKSGYTYIWSNSSPALPNGPGPYTVSPSSPTYYICTVTDACGSQEKDTAFVNVWPTPVAKFTATPNPVLGGEYVSFVNASTGATSYFWSFGNGSESIDSFPYYQYNIPGTYTVYLIAANQFGCADTAKDTIDVTEGIYVPNVFTPNGDGQNDVFHVTAGGMKTYSIEIFNRWGEKVFDTDSPNIDWTGRSNSGVQESDGIYYYILKATDYNNKSYNLDGYLQLIR